MPGTIVSLAPIAGEEYRLIVAKGEVIDTEELPDVPIIRSYAPVIIRGNGRWCVISSGFRM
jgi:hypothetical protein